VKFKEKHPEILDRFERFWRGAETDRPVLVLNYVKDASASPPEHDQPADRLRPEVMLANARHKLARTGYVAEGFPHFFVNYGPGVLHACLTGGDLHVRDERTIWFPEFLEELEDFTKLGFEREGRWWSTIRETTQLLLDEIGEEMVISYTDIGGNADVLASARGTEAFLLDCAMKPEVVRAAMDHVHELWMAAYNDIHELLAGGQDVFSAWYQILSPRRTYMTQCDYNAMIGPDMFRELFAPELAATYRELGDPAYHLDGVGTEPHVSALLEAGARCIQWVPPPDTSPMTHLDMFRRIQEAGIPVTFGLRKPGDLETACRELDHRRLCLLGGARTREEAEGMVGTALRICEGKS
jgi:hypothetical protein